MEKYELSLNDINSNYFHFTLNTNLESIEKNGLIPKKGEHAQFVEKTKKIFFVKGIDNLLILFDCWINIYTKVPLIPKLERFYSTGSKSMRSKFFPHFLVDFYFFLIRNSKRHKKYAYKSFDKFIDKRVILNLNLEEEVDFSYSDIDEIKCQGYKKRHLIELGYSEKYSDMNSNKMDNWNLHTLSDKVIEPNKIKLCFINNSYLLKDILKYAIENTNLDLKDICPVLHDYINSREEYK